AGRGGGHVVRDDLRPGPGDRGVELLRGALVGREVPDPAGDLVRGQVRSVPLHREKGEMDVLAVAERAARRDTLRQQPGELFGQGFRMRVSGAMDGMPAVRALRWMCSMRAIVGHRDTSDSASMTAWKPAHCCGVVAARAVR